jgi:PAS domain S-box-containing protein
MAEDIRAETKQEARARRRTAKAIAASEEWLFTALQSIGDAVIATDPEGFIVFMNSMAEKLTGWSASEAQGQDCKDVFRIINESTREESESPVTKVLRDGLIAGLANHTLLIAKDGVERCIDDSGSPIRNQEGELTGVVLIFRDVTDRRATERTLQEQNQILQTVFDHIPVIAAFFDTAGQFQWVNHEWKRVLGWPLKEMQGRGMMVEFYPDPGERPLALETAQWAAPGWRNFKTTARNGSVVTLAWANARLSDGSTVGIGYDISEHRYEAEAGSEATQAETEALNKRLQLAMVEVHHRVKNNFQAISALVDIQVMDHPYAVPVNRLTELRLHIRTLAAIHDLLTQNTLQGGFADRLSTKDALEELVPMLQATAGAEQIRLSVEDVQLPLRHGMLLAVLVNELVTNAVKHGSRNVDVTLTVVDGRIAMELCDDGPGFPAAFDVSKAASTGLKLVESMSRWDLGGDTAYQNRPEGGACVRVTFPLPVLEEDSRSLGAGHMELLH